MSQRILLAEDDKFLRRACEIKLRQHGFDVRSAVDGEEALTVAREWHPDLLLLDMLMPKRDGLSVLKSLKADPATQAIKIVVLSNSSAEMTRHTAIEDGAIGYWVKSDLSLRDLVDQVQQVLQEAGEHGATPNPAR